MTDPASLAGLEADVRAIVHLAAFKIPRYGKAIDTLKINYRGTENALEFARAPRLQAGARLDVRCLWPQSASCRSARTDSDSVIGNSKAPRWAYAVSKLFDEHLALAYQDAHGFPVTILRFFGSYGPKQNLSWWGGPQSVFIDCVLNDKPIPIHGDGSQTRSFTYVTDTVEGIYQATGAACGQRRDHQHRQHAGNRRSSTLRIGSSRLSGTPGELKHRVRALRVVLRPASTRTSCVACRT